MSSQKYKGLGRGLETLLNPVGSDAMAMGSQSSSDSPSATTDTTGLQKLPIFSLRSGTYQPRKNFNEASVESLAQSIKNHGLVQPIIAKKVNDKQYEIIAGERRWRAAQRAGLSEVPVVVRDDVNPEQAMAIALVENIQREDLNAIEEAEGLRRLHQEFNLTHEQISDVIGRSRAAVTNALRLLDLEERVQQLVKDGQLKMGHVRALLSLEGEQQWQIAQLAVSGNMSVRQVETATRNTLANKTEDVIHRGTQTTEHFQQIEQKLQALLRNNVTVQGRPNGSGKIQIPFGSINELNSLVQAWSQALNSHHQQTQHQPHEHQNPQER